MQLSGPKELSSKLLVLFFSAMQMQIISEIFPIVLGSTLFTQFAPLNKYFGLTLLILTLRMVESDFENIIFFMAA